MSTIERSSDPERDVGDAPRGTSAQDTVADGVDDAVARNPVIEQLTRLGWIAKGVVYILMGGTAVSIAQQEATSDDASPKGALDQVLEQPGGRLLLGVLALGLVLYALWRVLSVAVIRSNDLSAWADRIGYTFSAGFYAVLAWVAGRGALLGADPDRDNTVERVSRALMDNTAGRWVVLAGGVVTFAVGVFFVVHKGIQRSFTDDLRGVDGRHEDEALDRVLVVSGVAGWIGRGVVTMLVGFFVSRAAWNFDPDDARGFDGALRQVASTSTGTVLVWIAAVGLVVYGAFCLLSHRRRRLREHCA